MGVIESHSRQPAAYVNTLLLLASFQAVHSFWRSTIRQARVAWPLRPCRVAPEQPRRTSTIATKRSPPTTGLRLMAATMWSP